MEGNEGQVLRTEVLLHQGDRARERCILLMEHQRDETVLGMPFLASRFVHEYAELPRYETLLIRKVPGDTPGHLVEANASDEFIARCWIKGKLDERVHASCGSNCRSLMEEVLTGT